jgi:hypothetical protein
MEAWQNFYNVCKRFSEFFSNSTKTKHFFLGGGEWEPEAGALKKLVEA